jgi:hypothetical protein
LAIEISETAFYMRILAQFHGAKQQYLKAASKGGPVAGSGTARVLNQNEAESAAKARGDAVPEPRKIFSAKCLNIARAQCNVRKTTKYTKMYTVHRTPLLAGVFRAFLRPNCQRY